MRDLESYSALVVGIYERTAFPDRWPQLLESLTAFIGGRVGQLTVFSLEAMRRPTWAVSGFERAAYRTFVYRHAREDPRLPYILANHGRVVCGEDGVCAETFRASPLYREVVVPFGIEHSLVSFFAREADVMATVAAMRGGDQGPFGPEEAERFALVVPHLRRAFELYALLDRAHAKAGDVGSMLDLVDAAVFLVDRSLRVVHANRAAEDLARRCDGLAVRAKRLTCTDPAALRRLAAVADHALQAAQGRHVPCGADHLEIARLDEGPAYQVSVHPLPRDQGRIGLCARAELAVVVRRPGRGAGDQARRLQASLHLTPAEANLAASLASGASLDDHARDRGVALSTVRTQLKSLFGKTGTNRQAELVATLRQSLDVTFV